MRVSAHSGMLSGNLLYPPLALLVDPCHCPQPEYGLFAAHARTNVMRKVTHGCSVIPTRTREVDRLALLLCPLCFMLEVYKAPQKQQKGRGYPWSLRLDKDLQALQVATLWTFPMTGPATSVPQLLLYHLTVPELTVNPP